MQIHLRTFGFFVLENTIARTSVCFAQEWFVLKKRVATYLTNWMKYFSRKFYMTYLLINKKMLTRPWTMVIISLIFSIRKCKINSYNDWYMRSNFPDVFYFGANHLLLVHNHIMTITIWVFLNLTNHKMMKECDGIILPKSLTKLFVSMVTELVKQFFVHLYSIMKTRVTVL